jgi:hypothetical protein
MISKKSPEIRRLPLRELKSIAQNRTIIRPQKDQNKKGSEMKAISARENQIKDRFLLFYHPNSLPSAFDLME